jgi:hypothetical protein
MKRIRTSLVYVLSLLAAGLLRLWIGSLRLRIHFEQPACDPRGDDCEGNTIFVHWHEVLLPLVTLWGRCRQYTIISRSRDGEYTTEIARRLGWQVLRGSSSRGAVAVVRQTLELMSSQKQVHIAITADGPRGPRRQPKEGSVFLASKTAMSIIACGVAFDRPWRARSWDRLALPRPFSRAFIYFSRPIAVPPELERDALAAYHRLVWEELDRVDSAAQRMLNKKSDPDAEPLPLAKSA